MTIKRSALAGTLESSDALVKVAPSSGERKVELESVVMHAYGDAIRGVVEKTLDSLDIRSGTITITDRGALDAVLAARVETALKRACGEDD
ncbi:MAG: citrate lyase acyl carrier protein [Treponema sp.]|jgi:citrate lyase subunit gamma (acyl carrier protein)|nr:citrate lyase acyl carrier protein [Treponema sp.]